MYIEVVPMPKIGYANRMFAITVTKDGKLLTAMVAHICEMCNNPGPMSHARVRRRENEMPFIICHGCAFVT